MKVGPTFYESCPGAVQNHFWLLFHVSFSLFDTLLWFILGFSL